ncbi:MAG: Flp family type IVb pilin [Anaerolineae bacterium]|jgi:pilus assembly protein Flp/PilA|nr:Flp family type IVb pilin [Anaerolineae bacterium]
MLFSPTEKGQGLVEYALILVLVAIVVIAALMILGPIIGNVFSKINSSLNRV